MEPLAIPRLGRFPVEAAQFIFVTSWLFCCGAARCRGYVFSFTTEKKTSPFLYVSFVQSRTLPAGSSLVDEAEGDESYAMSCFS